MPRKPPDGISLSTDSSRTLDLKTDELLAIEAQLEADLRRVRAAINALSAGGSPHRGTSNRRPMDVIVELLAAHREFMDRAELVRKVLETGTMAGRRDPERQVKAAVGMLLNPNSRLIEDDQGRIGLREWFKK